MEKIYSMLANKLASQEGNSHSNYEIYRYGLQLGVEQGIFIITCFIIAWRINLLESMMVFIVVFFLVRPYMAGIHFNSFFKCYLFSVSVAVGIVILANNLNVSVSTNLNMFIILSFSTFIMCMLRISRISKEAIEFYLIRLSHNFLFIVLMYFVEEKEGSVANLSVLNFTLFIISFSTLVELIRLKIVRAFL